MLNPALFSSSTDNWATPQNIFDTLDNIFHFTLDPCADTKNAKCKLYYTKKDDGLTKDWSGHRVFCNPPYGGQLTGKWIKKCFDESKKPGTIVVALVPSRTDTRWFHEYIFKTSAEILFIKGRLKFGDGLNPAPFPSMIVIFGFHWIYLNNKGGI
ncbi:MAG: adenine methyltransferase [Clostridiaceae bacterium]|nr:adenine methyltransferase [Clostridiaceae bacterium]